MAPSNFAGVFPHWAFSQRHNYTRMTPQHDSNTSAGPRTPLAADERPRSSQLSGLAIQNDYGSQSQRQSIHFSTPTIVQRDGVARRLRQMCVHYPIRDMSWATGFVFFWGSAMFVINGSFLVIPTVAPTMTFPTITSHAAPATAIIGGIIFIIGGFAGYLEGLNFKREGHLMVTDGMRMRDVETSSVDGNDNNDSKSNKPSSDMARQHISSPSSPTSSESFPEAATQQPPSQLALIGSPNFKWYPPLREWSFYWRDLCFMSPTITFIGTFIFMLAIITGVPGVLDLTDLNQLYYGNLLLGTLGGILFTIASVMQTIDAQERWYLPNPLTLGWWIGAWNTIGSVGFTLASALVYIGTDAATLQAGISSLWGSCAFLVASLMQWYAAMEKYT